VVLALSIGAETTGAVAASAFTVGVVSGSLGLGLSVELLRVRSLPGYWLASRSKASVSR
jgi:hypothetical protein